MLLYDFHAKAKIIKNLHFSQTVHDVDNLKLKYSKPVFGIMSIWDGLQLLKNVVDPTDMDLGHTNQWVHTLQVVAKMENDNLPQEFIIAGWLHDLGKLLLLTLEHPKNIVCDNILIKGGPGFDNCIFTWNHDEFGYSIIKNLVSYKISWLVRYHSIRLNTCINYANEIDKSLINDYLIFKKYDKSTKSKTIIPNIDLNKHKKLLESVFKENIII